jgi:hypothetical protein
MRRDVSVDVGSSNPWTAWRGSLNSPPKAPLSASFSQVQTLAVICGQVISATDNFGH